MDKNNKLFIITLIAIALFTLGGFAVQKGFISF